MLFLPLPPFYACLLITLPTFFELLTCACWRKSIGAAESCKKFVGGPTSNFIYGLNFARDISQMKQTRRLFFHILLCFTDVFSPSVCKFIAKRDYENHNSGILAWVTSFTGEDTLGLIELNEFVFGANPRVDILHRVVVWQRAKRRAVSKL